MTGEDGVERGEVKGDHRGWMQKWIEGKRESIMCKCTGVQTGNMVKGLRCGFPHFTG